jgi:eukaryotic-like serine/threonine-protein kinase
MSPDRWRQVEDLYHAALEQTAEQRSRLLSGADPELRREVESLLDQPREGPLSRPVQEWPGAASTAGLAEAPPTIAHYRIVAKIGEGGMGTVYRATDTKLGREVALKVLRASLAGDPEYMARFQREAKVLASLNHPNIAIVHGLEESNGVQALVMELVEGPTLAARIAEGAILWKEALPIAEQIAEGLEAAHEKGVVHRDLKPGNVKIKPDGRVKVLDFGLAKVSATPAAPNEDSSTLTMADTEAGRILGTVRYMSPEQASGKPVDRRADIWAFGVVLWEMLTGKRLFTGETASDTLAGVLAAPIDFDKLPKETPPAMRNLVKRCLERDPKNRLRDIGEARIVLRACLADPNSEVESPASVRSGPAITSPPKHWKLIAPAAAVLASAAAGYFYLHRAPKLTDKDTIVLGDFDNKTGDADFDDTLRQGLAVQLHQSPFLSLVSDTKIRQTLQLMNKPPDQRLTADVTREICERTGSAAMLTGSIASLGTRYVLGLRAAVCSTGETLDEQQAQSGKKEDVLDALSEMAGKFRARAGESLAAIQQNNVPLREATTSSLEALKAYTNALKGYGSVYEVRTIALLKRATEIDPQFAAAWADLAIAYSDQGEQGLARESTANAYKWRDHTSGPEKFHIGYVYDRNVTGNLEKAWQTVSLWRQTYPRDAVAFDLSAGYAANGTGRYEEAIKFAEMAVALDPEAPTPVISIVGADLYSDHFDEASKAIQRYASTGASQTVLLPFRYYLAFLRGDRAEMDKAVSESKQGNEVEEFLDLNQALVAAQAGRLKDADRLSRRAIDLAQGAGAKERAATWLAAQAVWNGFYGNAAEASQRAEMALKTATSRDLKYAAAFAFALAHEFSRSQALAVELDKAYPEDTQVQNGYLPALRGLAAIGGKDPQRAIDLLQVNSAYEFGVPPLDFNTYFGGLYPVYVRGLAYLAMNRGVEAAAEFQKILDHKGLTVGDPVSAMARLQLARAWELAGDNAKAKAAYQQFLNLWKDADPGVPVLKQASAEFAKL